MKYTYFTHKFNIQNHNTIDIHHLSHTYIHTYIHTEACCELHWHHKRSGNILGNGRGVTVMNQWHHARRSAQLCVCTVRCKLLFACT